MEILINKLEFDQELLENGLLAWNINRKRYKKECLLMDIIVKIMLNIEKHFLRRLNYIYLKL